MISVWTLLAGRRTIHLMIITQSRAMVAVFMVAVFAMATITACSFETPDFNFKVEDLATAQSSRVHTTAPEHSSQNCVVSRAAPT